MKSLCEFKLLPDSRTKRLRRFYYRVVWFRTVGELRKLFAPRGGKADCCGFVRTFDRPKDDGQVGWIVLCKRWSGTGTLSHEAAHAAVRFMAVEQKVRTYCAVKWNEERLAWLTGNITRLLTNGGYTYGVFGKREDHKAKEPEQSDVTQGGFSRTP